MFFNFGVVCQLICFSSKPLQVTFAVVPVSTVDDAMGVVEGVGGIIYARPISDFSATTLANDGS